MYHVHVDPRGVPFREVRRGHQALHPAALAGALRPCHLSDHGLVHHTTLRRVRPPLQVLEAPALNNEAVALLPVRRDILAPSASRLCRPKIENTEAALFQVFIRSKRILVL